MMKKELYTNFFEELTPTTPLKIFENIYAKNAYFKDPFNEVNSVEDIYAIFAHMYKTLEKPTFKILEVFENEGQAVVRWKFEFAFQNEIQRDSFEGLSRLVFNDENKIISHIDYWDSSEHIYEKIPILGFFIRIVKNKIKS